MRDVTKAMEALERLDSSALNRDASHSPEDFDTVRDYILATQPAQASEKMTGAVPDTLPEFLEWVATQLLLRDTKAGTFAPGVSASLRGRAYILRIVEESK